ncbi:WD repeat domain-containing protein 83 [Tanacetum coccineum]|uniref:WD repeat domain-containing protein 83 n=1 Tax=Tanacetum coccineum TaxID=301880 RepID=A0ABQ4X7Z1_9ASTR
MARSLKAYNYDIEILISCFHHQKGKAYLVNAVKFNEFGSVIVAADTCVRLWDCRSPTTEPIQIFNTFSNSVTSLCLRRTEIFCWKRLSQNLGPPVKCISMADTERSILASCLNSTIQDTKYIEPFGVYKGHTCSEDGRVFMWNFMTGDVDAVLDGHSSAVTSVDYHPTDDSLLSASMDGSIILRKAVM